MSRAGLGTPPPATPAPPIDVPEAGLPTVRDPARIPRRLGLTGTLMMGIGALGAGALPVPNPLFGLRVISLPARNATAAIAITYAGMGMLVLAWLWIGRMLRAHGAVAPAPDGIQLARTGLLWALPLALAPPMFSKDVYSYLAQSEIAARGLDPYTVGPAEALGNADPLTRTVPTMWRDTPSPYGPLFITIGKGITWITGDHVVMGVAFHRLLALIGFAMIVWALPRLARRFGINPVSALWLGAANPLVLFHLIVGVHNEALAIGLMLVGMELALKRMPRVTPDGPFPPWQQGELLWYAIGATVITLAAAVKIPAALALGFLGVMIARRRGGRWRDLFSTAAVLMVLFLTVLTIASVGSGLGYGWTATLNTANTIKSWMAPMTALGFGAGGLGIMLGLGNHMDAAIMVSRLVGTVLGPLLAMKLLLDSFRWRLRPMIGLGAALGAVLVFGATVQPWYLLWAALPLAVAAGNIRFRTMAMVISAAFAVALPPTGTTFDGRTYQLPLTYVAAGIVVVLALLLVRKYIPSRPRRDARKDDAAGIVGAPA